MSPFTPSNTVLNVVDRYRFLMMLNAAEACDEFQFAKDASMLWLVNYPGDLLVMHHQAVAFANLNQKDRAIALLEDLIAWDPTFVEPYRTLGTFASSAKRQSHFAGLIHYLEQKNTPESSSEKWLSPLWQARAAFNQGDLEKATALVHESLVENPSSAIPAILHLQAAYKMGNQDLLNNLSEIYLQQWPKCLQINIIRALAEIEHGMESQAVDRLHWVAAHDSAGQVIQELMGTDHRFQNLWPDRLEIHFDLPIPASITTYLGWNQLNTGKLKAPTFAQQVPSKPKQQASVRQPTISEDATQKIRVSPADKPRKANTVPTPPVESIPLRTELEKWASEEDFEEIRSAFSKIAKRLKKPELERADNRFPVYVIMTSRKQLEKIYGPNTADVIDELLVKLVGLIQNLPDWGALLFYPDAPERLSDLGIKPVFGSDPWQIKLSLADLDNALAKRGEMIGALLIVGGPEIVPYHNLPNPTYDNDLDVPSDNPYACINENYFIAQWPVGRLPGEAGTDAGLLLAQIRGMIHQYQQRNKYGKSVAVNVATVINMILQFFSNLTSSVSQHPKNFGYSAEIWQRASAEVYKPIGNTKDLQLSPPIHASSLKLNADGGLRAGYFNLHGVKDGPHWYGQKDFTSQSNGPDYPIALSPGMFDERHPSPKLMLTEACYGAHIEGKRFDQALSLKCLDTGTQTFIGSTCIAYGSITPPLIAADYLAETFWQKVLEGLPAGYALMQAKLSLAEEMVKTQGFLDGEDQKTLLSFVLYGDPLAVHDGLQTMPKPLFRFKSYPSVKTVSDYEMLSTNDSADLPKQLSKQVEEVVEKYLPGLENAQMRINKSAAPVASKSRFGKSSSSERYMVTLQKSFDENQSTVHHHFARMTFNNKGKLVKFTTSR